MRYTRSRAAALLPAAFLLAFGACSPGGAASQPATAASAAATASAPTVHPVSGLPIIPLSVKTAKGPHAFRVELAATAQEQEKGLMFRTEMGADEGMIFPYDPARPIQFWMHNTVISLDIVFIGADHRILNIAANAVPYDDTPLPSAGPVSGVLELNGGRAAQLGIKPGDTVTW